MRPSKSQPAPGESGYSVVTHYDATANKRKMIAKHGDFNNALIAYGKQREKIARSLEPGRSNGVRHEPLRKRE